MAPTTTKDQPRRLEYQRLDDVRPAPRNPKAHDEAFLDGLIEDYGYTEPVLLDERTGRLVVGHGRLDALKRRKAAGQDPPEGIVVRGDDWLLPVVRGWRSRDDAHAEGYLIVSNKSPERGGWNRPELADMLAEYETQVAGWALGVGFDEDEYRDLLQETGRLGDVESDFLGDLDTPGAGTDPDPGLAGAQDRIRTGTDVVDFRLAMAPADRDEAVLILRREAKRLGRDTLAATLLDLLRALPVTAAT